MCSEKNNFFWDSFESIFIPCQFCDPTSVQGDETTKESEQVNGQSMMWEYSQVEKFLSHTVHVCVLSLKCSADRRVKLRRSGAEQEKDVMTEVTEALRELWPNIFPQTSHGTVSFIFQRHNAMCVLNKYDGFRVQRELQFNKMKNSDWKLLLFYDYCYYVWVFHSFISSCQ